MTKENDSDALLSRGMPIGAFTPCAFRHGEMDMLSVYTRDETTISTWANMFLESLVNVRGTVIGFHLVSLCHLQGEKPTMNVPTLLLRAFVGDMWRNRKRRVTRIKVVALYVRACSLLLCHPTTRRLK